MGEEKKEHVCMICGKKSDATICHACEEKIRGEALEKKKGVEKAGKGGSGRHEGGAGILVACEGKGFIARCSIIGHCFEPFHPT